MQCWEPFLNEFNKLCDTAAETHNVLLEMPLPEEENKRQQTWFEQKTNANMNILNDVNKWRKEAALIQHVAALEKKHALEAQEEKTAFWAGKI